mgnify:CR=1 FL=1
MRYMKSLFSGRAYRSSGSSGVLSCRMAWAKPGLRLAVVGIDIPGPPLEDGVGDLLKDLVALQAMPRRASARISRVSPGLIWNMSRISLGMTIWPFGPTLTELIYFSLSDILIPPISLK